MFKFIFWSIFVIIYLLSIIEIIGSYYLTKEKIGKKQITEFVLLPIFFPPLTPIAACDIYFTALEFYENVKENKYYIDESFFCYLKYGRKSINEYYNYCLINKKLNNNVK